MTLVDRIVRDSYTLLNREECRTGEIPKVVCYLGLNQRRELVSDFRLMPYSVATKPGEPWHANVQIGGCQVIYTTLPDHYNVTLLNS